MPRKTKVPAAETTAIVLRIPADHAMDFEAMFEAEEIPIWEDSSRRGRFLEARLVRAVGGSEQRGGIEDYILHIVAADHEAHEEHDRDPRFRAFLAKGGVAPARAAARLVRRHDLRGTELSPTSWPGLTARFLRADLVDELEYRWSFHGFGNPFDRVTRGDGAFFEDRQIESRSAAACEESPDHVGPPEPDAEFVAGKARL